MILRPSSSHTDPYQLMQELRVSLQENKPSDRSEIDRRYAIAITDCERLIGFFKTYVIDYEPPAEKVEGSQL